MFLAAKFSPQAQNAMPLANRGRETGGEGLSTGIGTNMVEIAVGFNG